MNPDQRRAFRTWLRQTQGCASSTALNYSSAVTTLLDTGGSPASAVQRTAWRHYQAWRVSTVAQSSDSRLVHAAAVAALDCGVPRRRHNAFTTLHLEVVEAFMRGRTWSELTASLGGPDPLLWQSYVDAVPWLQREHVNAGLPEIPDYVPPAVEIDEDVAYVVAKLQTAQPSTPWMVRWDQLAPIRHAGIVTHTFGGVRFDGGALWALASRCRIADPRVAFFEGAGALVVVDAEGYPLTRRTWDAHALAAAVPDRRLVTSALPDDIRDEINRPDDVFDLGALDAE